MSNYGPQTVASQETFRQKRCLPGETFEEVCQRLASSLTDDAEHYQRFHQLLLEQKFLPGGRIPGSIGTGKTTTAFNCFVSGKIEDSFVDGPGSIMQRAAEAAATMRMGGGIGYDFSTLRPRGAEIRKLQSNSTGPVSFMGIFDAVCRCVSSSGHRRGAQMAVLRVDHPDIEEFITAKHDNHSLTGFNISVGVTDAFMAAVAAGQEFALTFQGQTYRTVQARALWDQILRSAWEWAEPGVIFLDTINSRNNLWYCEQIATTNPCSEQPLPPYGACLLGSFNLTAYLRELPEREGRRYVLNLSKMIDDVYTIVPAMDNVINAALYPIPEQKNEALTKRRMGLGITGLANALEALGAPYGSEQFIFLAHRVMRSLMETAYVASAALAKIKGPFPAFSQDYLEGRFIRNLPERVQQLIAKNGIRNSHLISIAPTGTMSFCADNISSGIEPVFSIRETRTVLTSGEDGKLSPVQYEVEDFGHSRLGVIPRVASEVTASEHIDVLTTVQQYCDSSVSKTCNVSSSMPMEEFRNLYFKAWKQGAKGCSVFNTGGRRAGVRTETCVNGACDLP